MSWWSGTTLGFRVNGEDEEAAQQFLTILGVNMVDCDMYEEIGQLSNLYEFSTDGQVEGDLLGIMPALEKKFSDYQKKFDLFRNDEDKEEDEKLIMSLGIEPFVKIIDAKKNIHSLISKVSMFVITSDFEGLSNALAEAMLMGIPCISSDWPGSEDVITHNVNGYVYKRQNVAELASYMNKLANDDEKKVEFSVRAQRLQRHFDPKIVMEAYSKIIEG